MMLNYLRYRWCNFWRNRYASLMVKQAMQKLCDEGGLVFEVGDRVQTKNHRFMDEEGGFGTVVDVKKWNEGLGRHGLLVRFDSMPKHPLFMSAAELRYERK